MVNAQMSDSESEPTPPESAPKYLREGLPKQDPETLRAIAEFAEAYADYREQELEDELEEESVGDQIPPKGWSEQQWEETVADVDAPEKATLTVKTINDNDYFYYQWRDGDSVKSEYVAPVDPS